MGWDGWLSRFDGLLRAPTVLKIYDVNFVYSGGLWQHEIDIEKVF